MIPTTSKALLFALPFGLDHRSSVGAIGVTSYVTIQGHVVVDSSRASSRRTTSAGVASLNLLVLFIFNVLETSDTRLAGPAAGTYADGAVLRLTVARLRKQCRRIGGGGHVVYGFIKRWHCEY
jgi:hypothetical protein